MEQQDRPVDLQQVIDTQGIATIALEVIADGSGAVARFAMPGIAESAIVIPKPVVQQFVKQWLNNEKALAEVRLIALKAVREKRNGR